MTEPTIAQSGYVLNRVYFPHLRFEGVSNPDEIKQGPSTPIGLTWNWRIIGDRAFEVMVNVKTEPITARPERVDVLAIGRFELQGPPPGLALPRFVRVGAVSLIYPYAREAITNLTARGAFGPLFLDPVNLTTLDNFDMSLTIAAQQLRENPALGAAFGDVRALTAPPSQQLPLPEAQ
ncbi:MAG TPA: protein-export chaperone SecB [Gemmatimonadales bacterium]|jgi:preprotein translocase subunit SecB